MRKKTDNTPSRQAPIVIRSGRIWFTRRAERRIYFIMTLIILIIGVAYRLEWL